MNNVLQSHSVLWQKKEKKRKETRLFLFPRPLIACFKHRQNLWWCKAVARSQTRTWQFDEWLKCVIRLLNSRTAGRRWKVVWVFIRTRTDNNSMFVWVYFLFIFIWCHLFMPMCLHFTSHQNTSNKHTRMVLKHLLFDLIWRPTMNKKNVNVSFHHYKSFNIDSHLQ